jgi:hypothetical protein
MSKLSLIFAGAMALQLAALGAQAQVGPITCRWLPNGAQECRAPDGTIVPPPTNSPHPPPSDLHPPCPVQPPPPIRPQPQPPYYPPTNPGYPPSYALQAFERDEQDAIMWNQRYNQAPSGSFDERYARDQRDQAIRRALYDLQDGRAFDVMSRGEVEMFADRMEQKYNQAYSGSAMGRLYSQAAQIGYDAFNRALQRDLQNIRYDWRQVHQFALEMDQKYNSSPAGSLKEHTYDQIRRSAWDITVQAAQGEISSTYDFRRNEDTALTFDQMYNSSPSDSLKGRAYDQIRWHAFNTAVENFRANGRMYDLYSIQNEYNQKYNSAPSGSLKENYYRQIRDTARAMMGYR